MFKGWNIQGYNEMRFSPSLSSDVSKVFFKLKITDSGSELLKNDCSHVGIKENLL